MSLLARLRTRSICATSILLIGLLFASYVRASHTLLPAQTHVLSAWLSTQPLLRLATEADCGDCAADIAELRAGSGGAWTPVSDYEPYQAIGDFNNDGEIDFAVVLIDTSKHDHPFVLAIFNGPLRAEAQKPSFLKRGLDLRGGGLFFGPLRPKPYRLIGGHFGAEGMELKPRGASYVLLGDDCC
jgi:hypothetical protein